MSLRLRLTLVYSVLLSGIVALLSIIIYVMVSMQLVDFVDDFLQKGAHQIITALRADGIGNLDINSEITPITDEYYFQVWSMDGRLVGYSENASKFTQALDRGGLDLEEPRFNDVTVDQLTFRVLTVPLEVQGQVSGRLQVGMGMTAIQNTLRYLQAVLGVTAVFSIAVSAFVGWITTGQALAPLETMAHIARRIATADDLSQRIPISPGRNDEISALALTFNQTFVRLERLFDSQRRFLADVSHELRTPLTVIKGNVGLMRMMKAFDEEALSSIEMEVERLTRMVGDLLLMAQAEAGKLPLMLVPIEIDEILFEVFEEIKVLSGGKHDIRLNQIEPAIVIGDRDRIKQVLLNLGSNAVNYTPEGRKILFGLTSQRDWVQIFVSDEGQGVPKEELSRLFERFYRGEKSRTRTSDTGGFGLGLPIAYWIVRNHGGRIDIETEEGQGTIFNVWLPKSQTEIPTRPWRKNRQQQEETHLNSR